LLRIMREICTSCRPIDDTVGEMHGLPICSGFYVMLASGYYFVINRHLQIHSGMEYE